MQKKETPLNQPIDKRTTKQTEIAARRQNLSAKKQALLNKWQQKKVNGANGSQHIPQRTNNQSIPLSFAQQRLWFLEQFNAQTDVSYNIPIHINIQGALDIEALEYGLNQLLQRHEILRTRYITAEDGVPYQEIMPFTAVSLLYLDLSHLPPDKREAAAFQHRQQEGQTPFALETGPIYRIQVLRLEAEYHQLLFTIHHIAFDMWSTDVFLREIIAHYLHKTTGFLPTLPDATVQYADYTVWQQTRLTPEVMETELAFWRDHLSQAPAAINLPIDKPRPLRQTTNGDLHVFTIPAEIANKVTQWTQAEQVTLYMTLLTAFNGLLYRYTHQENIVVGTPIANRNHPDLKNIVGFFINTLALCTHIDETTTWQALLKQTQQTMLDAYAHQEYPFENLVQALLPERDPSRQPLFQVMFVLKNKAITNQISANLPIKMNQIVESTKTAKFDLLLDVQETDDGFTASIEYNTDLFLPETIQRMADHFQLIVNAMVTQPDQLISQTDLLTAKEQALMKSWNETKRPLPSVPHLHQLISQQAAQTPDRVAVKDPNLSLSYQELDTKSNQLAHYLQGLGVQPDSFVAVALERSAEMLIGLLGIWKAGGAYLPLDPSYPAQRLQFMLGDAEAPILLTQSSLVDSLPDHNAHILCLDTDWDTIAQQPETMPESRVTGDHLAYIIYTSGSTGRPKGVQIRHQALANLLTGMKDDPGITPDDKLLAITTLSFDIATVELYLPLLVGAQVVVAPQTAVTDPQRLINLLQSEAITLMQATPATWQMLVGADWQGQPGLRMITGGEVLTVTLAKQLLARGDKLWNMYAPSETTTYSTIQPVLAADIADADAIPIGRPLANTQLYILDEQLNQVPIGVTGELYIGGEGVAPGYLNQPALTAERFVENPFPGEPSARLYRTGDVVSFRADGAVNFFGRADHQVKIRGFRIELGEIESRLRQHPAVSQAVVKPHQQQLVAYLIFEDESEVASGDLRRFVQESLPAYMVPYLFMPLAQFPLTPNGKVDRQALPDPSGERDTNTEYVAPRTQTEQAMAEIWQNLLKVAEISIHDNFFELGGHSLLAAQLASRIQKEFNVKLALRDIFEQSTIAQMADLTTITQTKNDLPDIPLADPAQPTPVSFAQQRLLVIDQLAPNQATYNIPLALRLDGNFDENALQTAVNAIYTRHDSLRTIFRYTEDGQPYQQISDRDHLPINHLDLSHLPADKREEEALTCVQTEAQRTFSLTQGPLIRITRIQLAAEQHILVIVMHHIITDGWSMNIFMREMLQLYITAQQGQRLQLPPMRIQYPDFAAWQREWLQSDVLTQQLAYWENNLADAPEIITLPTDLPRPKLQSTRGSVYMKVLPTRLTQPLAQLSQTHQSSLFMTLLAAYNILLARYSQQDDIVVGTPIANRNHPDIENLIGFFVNMLPLRTKIDENDSFTTLLGHVRQTALNAYNHQDIPFEQLVDALQPMRDTSHSPLFQVAFSLQNAAAPFVQPNDVTLTLLAAESKTSKYDLTLTVTETNVGLSCAWEYNTDLFLPETIAHIHTHFTNLLENIINNPDRAIADLSLLSEAEREQLLQMGQGIKDPDVPQICLHERFEEWAAKQPQVTAVSDQQSTLSYEDLNKQANQLARLLIQQGVQPGDAIGIHMPASVPAIISIIACHKARAAYVPFDPDYPAQRLQLMIEDTATPVILTDTNLEQLETDSCTIWQWEAIQDKLAEEIDANLNLAYTLTDPAYIIYTSGSTGKPKGVVCGHTGVFNLQRSFDQWGARPPQNISALWTSLTFDVSVYEIFSAFISGGSLHIVPAEIRPDAAQLFTWMAQQHIQNAYLPPFMVEPFHQWLQDKTHTSSLQHLLVGVEPLAEQTLAAIQGSIPDLILINAYGPTEATVCTTSYRVLAESSRTGSAPIGRPLHNSQVYLLNDRMELVPVGVTGELYIGGMGLAHGYLNRPELTAERFVTNPFSAKPEARLYRTGDLVKYLPDGNIQFIGRTDFQLKVRGFRVELGEIESHLLALPGVAAGVIMPQTASDGQIMLIAYFVAEEGVSLNQQDLQDALNQALPSYMVPAIWVALDKMPRTLNDKIDRKALPLLNLETLERTTPFVPPRNPTEMELHAIWQSLLKVDEISIHDNFFELGGHSLLAMQLVSHLQKTFNVNLPLRDIFEQSSIAQMATLLDKTQAKETLAPIPLVDRNQPLPVSFAQQRLLIIDQLEPNQATYNIPLVFQINGRLDTAAFQQAVDTLYVRHETLRTSFVYTDDDQPIQQLANETHLPITSVDFTHLPADQRELEIRKWVQAEIQRPFTLSQAPLIRVAHIQVSAEEHVLVIVMHHIISDGWSVGVLFQEMGALYTAFVQGQDSPLADLPIQYADFAAWQRGWLQGDVLQQQLDYWLNKLKNAPAILNLPTDRPRPALQSYSGATLDTSIPVDLIPALDSLIHKENATRFMALLTAFQILLSTYTHQDDIVVGSPIANRNRAEIEGLIGFFVNMLVLRTDTSGNPSFRSLLGQVRETTLGAFAYQDIPFEKLVEEKQPTRDMSYAPLFQVSFILQNTPNEQVSLPGLTLAALEAESTTTKYDLTLAITETAVGLNATWEYSTALFDESTIARLAAHYTQLLQQIVAQPDLPINELEILTPIEKKLMKSWNETKRPLPSVPHLHQLISQQAAQTPGRVAVKDPNLSLSYQELDTKSNQLAHYLQGLGVQPDSFVAVALERSAEMLIGLLGIWKAGGAYLPLDPSYPAQRLQFMLGDAEAPILLTQSSLVDSLPDHNAHILCLDTDWDTIAQQPETMPESRVTGDHLAYIIYTSGSTGRPKGVQIRHQALANLLTGMKDDPGITPDDKLLAITTLSFDIATVELYLPLLVGAQVVVAPQTAVTDPQRLINLLQSEAITLMQATPATWQMLVGADWQGQPGLRMITGGEVLTVTLAKQLLARGHKLWNMYAPSETTTYSTIQPVLAADIADADAIPIGRPLANTQLYILDEQLNQVPIGVTGELYIGGEGVAPGYLNQPALTAKRFVENPFPGEPSARLYRTGDVVSFRADGAVNFFGRADHQVKIRGFRIELGEIESRLRQHPAVSQAVVKSHQQQLVAYLIFEDASEVASGDLRRFVQESLPAYMVPYLFMPLAQFPLTPNGKVDRQALPDPSGERDAVTEYVAPRTQTEQAMAEIWQNLLKVAEISIHDNFFELGGHSLLAAQLVSAMSRHFGKTIPLRLLFDAPTIVELTYQLQTLTDETTLEPIPKRPFSQPIPLSFAQQRLWFIEQMNSQANASYNIPIHFMIQGELDLAALEYSFNQLLQRHESLRTRYVVGDDEIPYQEIMPVTAVPLPFTDLSALAALEKEEKAQQIRRQNAQTPFDLENGPIYRCHILQTEEKTYQLLFTVHHIAFDAWSIDLFLREVMAHYLHKTTGMPLALSSIDTQFADYTIWQQERLTPEFLAQQLDFWRNHLAHAPLTIELPLDKPRPQWQTSNGNVHRFVIPAEIAADVKQLAQTEQATLFMTLFAAFNSLLYRYTNQEDIVVGTPIANRNHPDLANIIGFFLNTLALRSHIEETTTWHELLQQTRQTMLAAHDNQEYPFENLVQAILPDRDPSRSPLFQVMFVLQNRGDNEPLPANLPIQISQMEGSTNTAKFDLLLDVQETDNGFIASLEYNTDLFHASTISRMAEHFQQLVAAMAAQPSQLISQANLLTQQEQIQIERWNDTAATITETQLVHHRFEQQADAKPQAIAVEFGAHRMTYMQLETRANQLAHFLQTNGIGPNDLVGILLPRSLDMVTAVLAILKVGAGYVPLDPTYPTTRLEVMMQQAEVNLLLTHSTLSHTEMDCPCYDVDTLALDSFDTGRITAVIPPTQAVYVIYTSGSTGQPKGVILPHRALDNLLSWQRQATHLKQPARTLQFTSLSFDVHFQEIFTTWQEGGTLVLIPDDVRRDGEQLLAYIQTHQIERLFLPFVALHNLAEAAQWAQSYPNTLREIITAGEALQATPAIRELFTQLPHCVLHNQYGPSESHVVTQHTLSDDPTRWPALPSIGKPVANTQIHLLDTHLKPVPIGISGELYIGGHNLALGYINQPQLTADRFISNPFSANPEARLYKTGDLARYLPNGDIQFIGRNDFQVKIRGHRIELGEIETVLNQQPIVQQAVVQAHKSDTGSHQLIAYVKTTQDGDDIVPRLHAALHEQLPAYMVPAHFMQMKQFPLTASGKINRRALPIPDKLDIVRTTTLTAPETDLQKQLVQVWEDVLHVSPIGIHDNFFELGGHSLLALRLVSAIHKVTGVKLPLPRLFQEGTIAAIATYINDPIFETPLSPIIILRSGDPDLAPLILIHPGSGQVLPYLTLVDKLPAEQPIYGVQSLGLLPDTPAQIDIETMTATYLQALAEAQIPQPYHLTGWSMGGVVALEMAQQLAATNTPVRSLTLIDTYAPNNQSGEPNDTQLLQWFVQDAGYLMPSVKLTLLPDEAETGMQLQHLWQQLQETGDLPPALTLADLQQQFAVFRANYAAMQAYKPQRYSQPVHMIVAKDSAKSVRSKWLGWKKYFAKKSVNVLRTTHFDLLKAPHVTRIAKEITRKL